MSERKRAWVNLAARRMGTLDPLEEALANAVADVLASGSPAKFDLDSIKEHEVQCAAALVAIVELARAVSQGRKLITAEA